ncbi:MAG: UDP-2,3-diacylglucosamine diphosphatase [Opitutaceae bacterium]
MKKKDRYRTIILSDVHLGTPNCKVREVIHFLKRTRSDRLILNGDIIDCWQLKKGSQWTNDHTRFVRLILKKMERRDTEIIYLRGNHDDVLARFLPLSVGTFQLAEDYVLESTNGRYLVLHGDVFDSVIKNVVFLAHLGDLGYQFLMSINRIYNHYRTWRGKDYFSLSKAIKAKVKSAVSFISRFEEKIAALARSRDCRGVIVGHIHTPDDKMIDGIHYLNSGDWVESLTAIGETHEGEFELIEFGRFLERQPMIEQEEEPPEPPLPIADAIRL